MAYGVEAAMHQLLGEDLFDALCTMPGSQTADQVYAQARTDADAEIDASLAQTYAVPFAQITDSPATPALITTISNHLTAANLFQKRHPQQDDYRTYRERAEVLLARLLSGEYEIPGAAKVAANDGRVGVAYLTDLGATPIFAGTDDDGNDRMSGW